MERVAEQNNEDNDDDDNDDNDDDRSRVERVRGAWHDGAHMAAHPLCPLLPP